MAKYSSESSSLGFWIIAGITLVALLVIGWLIFGNSASTKTTRELAAICTTDMATQFHIHPVLKIIINGETQTIPSGVGINAGCMNPLHTHDDKGIVHVESPEKRDFTLGDFFFVWGKPFNQNQILDFVADDNHTIRQTVNGQEVQDFENTVLYDNDKIVIYYEEKK